jgi:hypothetical protein
MKRLLLVTLIFSIAESVHAEDAFFIYGGSPWRKHVANGDLIVGFNIRKNGDPLTVADFRFPQSSKWRQLLDDQVKKNDLEYSYFEIITKQEIPKARGFRPPHLDIVTKEVLRDLAEISSSRRESNGPQIISDSTIVSMRLITQNEFLQVSPRKIPDPTK